MELIYRTDRALDGTPYQRLHGALRCDGRLHDLADRLHEALISTPNVDDDFVFNYRISKLEVISCHITEQLAEAVAHQAYKSVMHALDKERRASTPPRAKETPDG